jgi:hypothetical protein
MVGCALIKLKDSPCLIHVLLGPRALREEEARAILCCINLHPSSIPPGPYSLLPETGVL